MASWVLTSESFERLLARFSADRTRAGELYEDARRRLCKFFEWRGALAPEELSDETLNRVARKLESGEVIESIDSYLLGVARLVLLENLKESRREREALENLPPPVTGIESEADERRIECFERCLAALPRESRELMVEYHREEKRAKIELRRELAERYGLPLNALRIRVHRLRSRLEECVRKCLLNGEG